MGEKKNGKRLLGYQKKFFKRQYDVGCMRTQGRKEGVANHGSAVVTIPVLENIMKGFLSFLLKFLGAARAVKHAGSRRQTDFKETERKKKTGSRA